MALAMRIMRSAEQSFTCLPFKMKPPRKFLVSDAKRQAGSR